MDYKTYEELHNEISKIVSEKYKLAAANVIFLEELHSKNFVIYMTQFRDVLTHLSNIYSVDVFARKTYVLEQLERINGHLERIVIDSYRKICDIYLYSIRKSVKWINIRAYEMQIAQRIKQLRMCDSTLNFKDKCNGFQELISYMEEILKKD